MTRRISPLPGALDVIFSGQLFQGDARQRRAQEDNWRPERKRRTGSVSPMRRNRFGPGQDVS